MNLQNCYTNILNTIVDSSRVQSYPPYNVKRVGDLEYVIELAVAGFKKEHLNVEIENNTLVITGKMEPTDTVFLWKGISTKSFTRKFSLAYNAKVKSAELDQGLLTITLVAEQSKKKVEVQ